MSLEQRVPRRADAGGGSGDDTRSTLVRSEPGRRSAPARLRRREAVVGVCHAPSPSHCLLPEDTDRAPATDSGAVGYAPSPSSCLLPEDPVTDTWAVVEGQRVPSPCMLPDDPATWAPSPSPCMLPEDPATWAPSPSPCMLPEDPATWAPSPSPCMLPDDPDTWATVGVGRPPSPLCCLLPEDPNRAPAADAGTVVGIRCGPSPSRCLLPEDPDLALAADVGVSRGPSLLPEDPERAPAAGAVVGVGRAPSPSRCLLPEDPDSGPGGQQGELNLGFEDTEPEPEVGFSCGDFALPICDHSLWKFPTQVPGVHPRLPEFPSAPDFPSAPEFPSAPDLPSDASQSSASSGDIDWSWVPGEEERQRRVAATPTPTPPSPALAPLGPLPLQLQQRPCRASAPPTHAHAQDPPAADFPRRYSMSALGRRIQRQDHRLSASSSSSSSSESTPEDGHHHASESNDRTGESRAGGAHWPHGLSSALAVLGCTLGLCNISRFAILSVQLGANFILQFMFLTLVLGIPLLTVQASLGQYLNAGIMDMWRISPIFQGVGIALLVSQALIGIYSIVGVSWMFIYFRDSFITKQDQYPWAIFEQYRQEMHPQINSSHKLEETVPDYLNGMVLQRQSLVTPDPSFGHLKFQVTFNLAVVWMIVFVSLSKGLKSYGKVVYVFSLFSVLGMLILCTKILGLTNTSSGHKIFPETVWSEFFINTKCWVAATTEVFYTWGLLGAAIMQITSHNRHKHLLHRDISIVIIVTLAVLLLSAFLANTCVELLAESGYTYIPSSFERLETVTFLQAEDAPPHPVYARTPVRYLPHSTFVLGSRVLLPGMDSGRESGYQVLRLATELAPATFALMGSERVSPFWAVLFYFVLITFGIAQQLAIWHCVITGITAIKSSSLKSWETTITFFSCACGFVLGLPMTTELGIFVVYFMDFVVGSGWWIMVLYLLQIAAVFVVRGRPYSGESVVSTLFTKGSGCLQVWAGPMLVFTWNVILPVALMVLCITIFKNGRYREIYIWHNTGHDYWPLWVREIGSLMQILPLLAAPLVAVIQSCRYLSGGPPDLFDRIRLLYRPPVGTEEAHDSTGATNNVVNAANTTNIISSPVQEPAFEDPPPKYTPPPSYTTATGARIAKLLRQSFRRSVRRIARALTDGGDPSESAAPPVAAGSASSREGRAPPPDYATVLVEMNGEAGVAPPLSTMTAAQVVGVLRSSVRRPVSRSRRGGAEAAKVERHSTSLI